MEQEMRDQMPADGEPGWHDINAGPNLRMKFSPNRQIEGRDPNGVLRKTIVVALAGSGDQALRLDPFSEGAHYHIRPMRGGGQIPLEIAKGQTPLAAALMFFENPSRFREMLVEAEGSNDVATLVTDDELTAAAVQIRAINAPTPAA